MVFANGKIPLDQLQHLGGDHYLPAGTAARWLWMVAAGQVKYGVTLRITPGPNAYRWFDAQVDAKRAACGRGRCQDAADPGSSSHGGVYKGRPAMAIDVTNWRDLAPGDEKLAWARFAALCRLAGFTTLLFSWEPWHIVDFNDPWTVPENMRPAGIVARHRQREDTSMYVGSIGDTAVYEISRDRNGRRRMDALSAQDAAFAEQGGLVIRANPDRIEQLAKDLGYRTPYTTVAAEVWGTPIHRTVDGKVVAIDALQELADVKTISTRIEQSITRASG